jgi:predicted phage terminase large subunit-like protein
MIRVRGWDFAGTTEEESATAAYSAAVKMGRAGERIFVGPVWRKRESAAGVDLAIETITRRDGRGVIVSMPKDPGQAGKDQGARRGGIAKRAGAIDVRVTPEYGSKSYRADGFAAECEAGNVYLIDDGTWDINAYIDELCDFPTGAYADQVDASARACNELTQAQTIGRVSVRVG